jgi:tetratricopeptide (TPR) repeat protein
MSVFRSLFGWLFGPVRQDAEAGEEAVSPLPGVGPEPPTAVVAVGRLDGTGGEAAATRLAGLLGRVKGIEVRRWDRLLKPGGPGNPAQKLAAAADLGREWLAAEACDLLIWGESDGRSATLRFLAAKAEAGGRPGAFGLGDTLDLPAGLAGELDPILVAVTLAAAASAREGQRYRLSLLLGEAADKANGYVEIPPQDLAPAQLASLLTGLGNTFGMVYRLTGDLDRLRRSTEAYMAAIARCPREEAPVTWALAQNHLAGNLESLAEATRSPVPLEAAAKAYQAVIEALPKAAYPLDWALAQMNLGRVLYHHAMKLGTRTKELKEAVLAFEAALQVMTRDAMPGRWAEIQNEMGTVLLALGEQVQGNAGLELAATAFRKALEVRRRDLAPLLWAQTANNLGAAAFALAKRTGDTVLLNEAHACFEGALDVYRKDGRDKVVHVIEKNLLRVERLLQTRAG